MNWGEIQIESLKKMFLNNEDLSVENLSQYKSDKKYKTYLFAMPQACNEAINYINSRLGSKGKIQEITKTNTDDFYNLSELIQDFKSIKNIMCPSNTGWISMSKDVIYISNWTDGKVYVTYETKPTVITSTTLSTQNIELSEEYVRLIPLYIAGELYKDDDLTLATMYMNEFMTLVDNFYGDNYGFTNPSINSTFTMN